MRHKVSFTKDSDEIMGFPAVCPAEEASFRSITFYFSWLRLVFSGGAQGPGNKLIIFPMANYVLNLSRWGEMGDQSSHLWDFYEMFRFTQHDGGI